MAETDVAEFTSVERAQLMRWFSGHPVCRFWFRGVTNGVDVFGYVTNADQNIEEIELRLEGKPLNDVVSYVWHGLDDPEHDPDPTGFRVLRWWPRVTGFSFNTHIPYSILKDAGEGKKSVRLDITNKCGELVSAQSQSAYLPTEDINAHLACVSPPKILMDRVMGVSEDAEWILTGCTNMNVISQIAEEVVGKPLGAMGPLLEWGSGCGRLSRHLIRAGMDVTGIDIDGGAVAWCNEHLASQSTRARFLQCGLQPPTELPSNSFGVGIGISVITHLDEPSGDAWLAELARLLRPGGIMLLTTHGLNTFSHVSDPQIFRKLQAGGMYSQRSSHLDSLLGDGQEYYRETFHSWKYIHEHWSEWFGVLDIRRGAHMGFQVLVVMRKVCAVAR